MYIRTLLSILLLAFSVVSHGQSNRIIFLPSEHFNSQIHDDLLLAMETYFPGRQIKLNLSSSENPQLIIALGDDQYQKLLDERYQMLTRTQVIFAYLEELPVETVGPSLHLPGPFYEKETIARAYSLHPEIEHIYIVNGFRNRYTKLLPELNLPVKFHYIEDLDELNSLPLNALIFWGHAVNSNQQSQAELLYLRQLSRKYPIYSDRFDLLGHGIIGGVMLNPKDYGDYLGRLATSILLNQPSPQPRPRGSFHYDPELLHQFALTSDHFSDSEQAHSPLQSAHEVIGLRCPYALSLIVLSSLAVIFLFLARRFYQKKSTHFLEILNSSEDLGVILITEENNRCRIKWINEGTKHLLGYNPHEITNLPPKVILSPEISDKEQQILLKSDETFHGELALIHADKTIVPCLVKAVPLSKQRHDKTVYKVWIIHSLASINSVRYNLQVTSDQLKDTSKLLEVIFDAIPEPLTVYDEKDRLIKCNKAAAEFLEIDPIHHYGRSREVVENIINKPLPGADITVRPSAATQCRVQNKPTRLEKFVGDKEAWIDERAYPVMNEFEQAGKIISHLRDITTEHESQLTMDNLNKLLEQKVTRRTQELQTSLDRQKSMQEQLLQSEKMASLGNLVAGVAHEVNTPVGIAVTASSHLSTKSNELSDLLKTNQLKKSSLEQFIQTATESTALILSNLKRASDLIGSFKKVAVDQSNYDQRPIQLKTYLQEIVTSLRPELRKHQVEPEIKCTEEIRILSCPGALSQVITNLTMNSLIHAFSGVTAPQITISAELTDNQQTCHLTYQDNGCGIPEEHLSQIYEPFFTTKRGQGGSGLGMHLVFNLVTQTLGGHLKCESKPNEGTTFHLYLPNKENQK